MISWNSLTASSPSLGDHLVLCLSGMSLGPQAFCFTPLTPGTCPLQRAQPLLLPPVRTSALWGTTAL